MARMQINMKKLPTLIAALFLLCGMARASISDACDFIVKSIYFPSEAGREKPLARYDLFKDGGDYAVIGISIYGYSSDMNTDGIIDKDGKLSRNFISGVLSAANLDLAAKNIVVWIRIADFMSHKTSPYTLAAFKISSPDNIKDGYKILESKVDMRNKDGKENMFLEF